MGLMVLVFANILMHRCEAVKADILFTRALTQ
jgi:hypothetical protein